MSRRPARFTEVDLARAVRVAERHGNGWGVEILLDGTIRLYRPGAGQESPQKPGLIEERAPLVF